MQIKLNKWKSNYNYKLVMQKTLKIKQIHFLNKLAVKIYLLIMIINLIIAKIMMMKFYMSMIKISINKLTVQKIIIKIQHNNKIS